MEKIEFINLQKDSLCCMICLDICVRAVQVNCCEQLMCYKCAKSISNSEYKSCPNCKQNDIQFVENLGIQRVINSIKQKCEVCKEEMQRDSLLTHLKEKHKDESQIETLLSKLEYTDDEQPPNGGVFPIHRHEIISVSLFFCKRRTPSSCVITFV